MKQSEPPPVRVTQAQERRDARVLVVTATIGHPSLERALRSAQGQGVNVDHWVVVDGPEFEAAVRPVVDRVRGPGSSPTLLVLPRRTGLRGWCSHRIYAATPFLSDADFVSFLDQDNWFDPDHLHSLLETARGSGTEAAYSLRKVCDRQGRFVCRDDCSSLGLLHDCYDTPGSRHIDTNCWLLSRQLATKAAFAWGRPYVGDRTFAAQVMEMCPRLPCTGSYSVNYTVSSRPESAPATYFLIGNDEMSKRYPEGLPWNRAQGSVADLRAST